MSKYRFNRGNIFFSTSLLIFPNGAIRRKIHKKLIKVSDI